MKLGMSSCFRVWISLQTSISGIFELNVKKLLGFHIIWKTVTVMIYLIHYSTTSLLLKKSVQHSRAFHKRAHWPNLGVMSSWELKPIQITNLCGIRSFWNPLKACFMPIGFFSLSTVLLDSQILACSANPFISPWSPDVLTNLPVRASWSEEQTMR